MGREVRRVPASWNHPKNGDGHFIPLYEGGNYQIRSAEWDEEYQAWQDYKVRSYKAGERWRVREPSDGDRYTDYAGPRPSPDDYMPDWPAEQRTHLMMYEDTSEGTPLSPAFVTPEDLARWLVDNEASAFGSSTGSYEGWLRVAQGGFAPSMIVSGGVMQSGVDGMIR